MHALIFIFQPFIEIQCRPGLVGRLHSVRTSAFLSVLHPNNILMLYSLLLPNIDRYSALKKKIYEIPERYEDDHPMDISEQSRLMSNGAGTSANDIFKPMLDRELEKISSFYAIQEKEVLEELEELEELIRQKEEEGLNPQTNHFGDEDDDDDDDDEDDHSRSADPAHRIQRKPSTGEHTSTTL